MTIDDQYLVCGDQKGSIRFYDFNFWLISWFENLNLSKLKSISFSRTQPIVASQNNQQQENNRDNITKQFACAEFLVADSSACVMQLRPTIFEAINDNDKKKDIQVLMNGIRSHVSAVACHPTKTLVAFAIGEGYLQLWDYVNRKDYYSDFSCADINSREKNIASGDDKKKPGDKKKYQFYNCI